MQLSIVIPIRNAPSLAGDCLRAAAATYHLLGKPADLEFIVIDDGSDPALGISDLMRWFQRAAQAPTQFIRLRERRYYAYAVSMGLSLSRGRNTLMISHDMDITPAYVKPIVEVAEANPGAGLVRGCSQYMDGALSLQSGPATPPQTYPEVLSFSEASARQFGLATTALRFLIGDSFLVKRDVIQKIGVMDVEYKHLFADLDYGLRAQRAGFEIICARGAWLSHLGSGHSRDEQHRGKPREQVARELNELVNFGYQRFRQKWGTSLGPFNAIETIPFEKLAAQKDVNFSEFESPIQLKDAPAERIS